MSNPNTLYINRPTNITSDLSGTEPGGSSPLWNSTHTTVLANSALNWDNTALSGRMDVVETSAIWLDGQIDSLSATTFTLVQDILSTAAQRYSKNTFSRSNDFIDNDALVLAGWYPDEMNGVYKWEEHPIADWGVVGDSMWVNQSDRNWGVYGFGNTWFIFRSSDVDFYYGGVGLAPYLVETWGSFDMGDHPVGVVGTLNSTNINGNIKTNGLTVKKQIEYIDHMIVVGMDDSEYPNINDTYILQYYIDGLPVFASDNYNLGRVPHGPLLEETWGIFGSGSVPIYATTTGEEYPHLASWPSGTVYKGVSLIDETNITLSQDGEISAKEVSINDVTLTGQTTAATSLTAAEYMVVQVNGEDRVIQLFQFE